MGVTVDANGNLYIADTDNHRIRKVDANTGVISTVAGNGIGAYNGDGILATNARLNKPSDVAIDAAGNLYIADQTNNRIRKVDANTKIITTIAGGGGVFADGVLATATSLNKPASIVLDAAGNLYISDHNNNRIRKVNASDGFINTIAGTNTAGFFGDGGPATAAQLRKPWGLALDADENLYFADFENNRIRKIDAATGNISTIAGSTASSSTGDGSPAVSATLNRPAGIAISSSGTIFISEQTGNRIRKITANGKIYAVAGPGIAGPPGYVGDNGPATSAYLNGPTVIEVDADANLFVADYGNMRIRRIEGFVNLGLTLVEGELGALSTTLLEFVDTNQPATSIVYTVTSSTGIGVLFKDDNGNDVADAGETLAVNSTFTQDNINTGIIKYQHDGSETFVDNFVFSLTDGAGKNLSDKSFNFTIKKYNDAPEVADSGSATWTTPEDVPLTLGDLQLTDPDVGSDVMTVTLSVANGIIQIDENVSNGLIAWEIMGNNSSSIQIDATLASLNATLADPNGFVFVPNSQFNGSDEVYITMSDNGNLSTGVNGGQYNEWRKTINITAVNDAPVITSNAGGAAAAISINENTTAVTTVAATDILNEASTLTYSISGGADQALFSINPATGVLAFVAAPAFRTPGDADANNTYEVTVRVTDDGSPTPVKYDEQTITVTVLDTTPPRVTSIVRLTPADATTKVSPVIFRVTFDESVSNVDIADFLLSKTATATGSIATVSASSGTQMDVTVTGVGGDGTLRLDVKGSGTGIKDPVGLDLAEAFSSGEVYTIDNTPPVITGVEDAKFYPTDRTVSFNEGTATLNGSVFANNTVVSAEGNYTLVVTDVAGNFTTLSFDIDKTAPTGTLVINSNAAQTNLTSVSLALTTADGLGSQTSHMRFSNDNSTWSAWEPYATAKTHTLLSGDGLKTVYVELRDAVGNVSAPISDQINLDQTQASISITTTAVLPTNLSSIPVTVTFSEPVTGFDIGDIVVTGGTKGPLSGSGDTYTFNITPSPVVSTHQIKVDVAANVALDVATNSNLAAPQLVINYDNDKPTLNLSSSATNPTNLTTIPVTVIFSEPVTGFDIDDIVVAGGTKGTLSGSGNTYTFNITPSPVLSTHTITVDVAANVARDAATNDNTAATQLVINYDGNVPTVVMTAPTAADPTNLATIPVTVKFSEPVTGFTIGDILVTGGTKGTLSGSGDTYTFDITPNPLVSTHQIKVNVAAAVARDAATNDNTAAPQLVINYDGNLPTVVLTAPTAANPTNLAIIPVTVTFNEPVTGFDIDDIVVTGGV
ncbi:MAG: Ig-like domain-containing protein, partial [Adhaeribacter sp.]